MKDAFFHGGRLCCVGRECRVPSRSPFVGCAEGDLVHTIVVYQKHKDDR